MESQCKRTSPSDLISNLPNNVIEHILQRMPLQDAVRTSVLSKKWEHAWETLPQLVFDPSFGKSLSNGKLLLAIFGILLAHRGAIVKFQLYVPRLGGCHDIGRIVNFISRNGVQELTLQFSSCVRYKIPPSLFSCLDLKYLQLRNCSFRPPVTFNGWKNLTTFKFEYVSFIPDVIENFFSQFPLLEELRLQSCGNIEHLNIHTSNLRSLWIESDFTSIDVKASHLKTAFIDRSGGRMIDSERDSDSIRVDVMDSFYCSHGSIESLEIGYCVFKDFAAGYVPTRFAVHFDRLEYVRLRYTCFQVKGEVQFAIFLIRSSPCLRRLSVELYPTSDDDTDATSDDDTDAVMEFLKLQDHADISFNQLRSVTITNYEGTEPEMEFVKLMLARSPLLEIMKINIFRNVEMEEELRILKEIIRFPRASAAAVIEIGKR